jgi:hypothetical protein
MLVAASPPTFLRGRDTYDDDVDDDWDLTNDSPISII